MEDRSGVGAIGEQFCEKRKLTEQRCQQPDAAVTILNTSGMNDRAQQQTLHVDENMSFLAFDQFARIEPVRINAGPPFSALFTLWLSMMQAVGLAARLPSRDFQGRPAKFLIFFADPPIVSSASSHNVPYCPVVYGRQTMGIPVGRTRGHWHGQPPPWRQGAEAASDQ